MKFGIIICWLCLVVLTGCKQEKGPILISEKEMLTAPSDITTLVKDWSYVKLNLKEVDISGGSIIGARLIDHYILLEGYREEGKYFLLFETSGKFITKIDKSNLGQEWQESMLKFSLNPFRKEVVIVDAFKHIGYWFDFTGKFLKQREYNAKGALNEFYYLSPSQILGCNQVALQYKTAYFTLDTAFQCYKTIAKHDVSWESGAVPFANKAVAIGEGQGTLMLPLCDTLYTVSTDGLVPAYILGVHQNAMPGLESDYLKLCKQLEKQGSEVRQHIFETNRHLWLGYDKSVLIYDKISRKGVFVDKGARLCSSQMIPPRDLAGNTPDALVSCLTGKELQEWAEYLNSKQVIPVERLSELLKNAAGEDCVVLISYQLNCI